MIEPDRVKHHHLEVIWIREALLGTEDSKDSTAYAALEWALAASEEVIQQLQMSYAAAAHRV